MNTDTRSLSVALLATTLLRPVPRRAGRVALAVRYLSAAEDSVVGGDFYDVAVTPYGVRLVVGDVKGKGLEAVQLAATVLGSFRQAAFTRRTCPPSPRSWTAAPAGSSGRRTSSPCCSPSSVPGAS